MSQKEHITTEKEIKEIWERLTAGEASGKSAHHRIDNLEKMAVSMHEMSISVNQTVGEIKALREDFKKVDERIEKLEEKPVKRYETVVTTILTAVCSGLVGYLLSFLLK